MAVVLKIAYQGQTRRIQFENMPDYSAFETAVKESLRTCSAYSMKYVDDEGDLCTLVEYTFPDFLTSAKVEGVGQVGLRIEVIPLAGALTHTAPLLLPAVQTRKAHMRRQQQTPKPVWADDERDLEDLLGQFTDGPISKKNRKKRKNKSLGVAWPQEHRLTEDDASPMVEKEERGSSDFQVEEEGDLFPDVQKQDKSEIRAGGETENLQALAEHMALEHAGQCQTEAMDCGTDDDMSLGGLRKASSCPCLSILGSMQVAGEEQDQSSLLAQAWPFVDTDKLSADLNKPFQVTEFATQEVNIAPPQENTVAGCTPVSQGPFELHPSSSPPFTYAYQEVVWMPVLINWLAADISTTTPYAGLPLSSADNAMIPGIGC